MAKVSRSALLKAAKELGIELPEDEYARLMDAAAESADPGAYLREFAANQRPGLRDGVEAPAPALPQEETDILAAPAPAPPPFAPEPEIDLASIGRIPLARATTRVRVRHVRIHLEMEPESRDRLARLVEGLAASRAQLRPRIAGEPPRPVDSAETAFKWLLEQIEQAG